MVWVPGAHLLTRRGGMTSSRSSLGFISEQPTALHHLTPLHFSRSTILFFKEIDLKSCFE
jgi:hypothetical protein